MNKRTEFQPYWMIPFSFVSVIKVVNKITRAYLQDSIIMSLYCCWTHLKLTGGFCRQGLFKYLYPHTNSIKQILHSPSQKKQCSKYFTFQLAFTCVPFANIHRIKPINWGKVLLDSSIELCKKTHNKYSVMYLSLSFYVCVSCNVEPNHRTCI